MLLAVVILISALTYRRLDQTYYIEYNESSSVDYKVHLQENDFYEEEWLDKGQSYVASLIDTVNATFDYKLDMQSADIEYEYSYTVTAQLLITDKGTGLPLYDPETVMKPTVYATQNSNKKLHIRESVVIDYPEFNRIASEFISTYDLKDVRCEILVTMNVAVIGNCEEFESNTNNNYNVSLSMPLTSRTVDVEINSTVPTTEGKVIACSDSSAPAVFKTATILFGVIEILLIIALFAFTYLTRNEDINYTIKVNKILKNYRSFIQKITNEFNTDGYQLLKVNSFNEMLGIRDTIQSPILACENEDRTRTSFVIPSNTKILYIFEIKVDDYDEIYKLNDEAAEKEEPQYISAMAEEIATEASAEEVKAEANVIAPVPVTAPIVEMPIEVIKEPIIEPAANEGVSEEKAAPTTIDSILENLVDEDGDDTDDDAALAYINESGERIRIPCRRSYTANLIQSNPQVKQYYNEIKNLIMSYIGVKSMINWRIESFNKGRINLFKLKIRGKTICLYCALKPENFDKAKYFHEEITAKSFANVPMMIRIKSDRGLSRAKGLIELVMDNYGIIPNPNATYVDYAKEYPYETTKALVERKLIKILLPGAEAAEPQPHHHVHKLPVDSDEADN